jgi:hypothetical protein
MSTTKRSVAGLFLLALSLRLLAAGSGPGVNVEARYTSYVDNAKGSGITGEVQAFATYVYKGKPQTLIEVNDPPKTVLADAGTHCVARIGDTFQIRIFDRADVTLPADPQDSVGMSSGINLSVQVVPLYRGAAPGHKRF